MNLESLSLQAIDALVESWATDTAKSVAESREESAAVIGAVFAPVIAEAESKYKPAMLALESLTPGGSEYVGDVERCVAHIRDRQSFQHNLLVEWKRKRDDAERRLGLAREALTSVKIRICYINHPREAMHNGGPDWSKQIALIEEALAQLGAPSSPVDSHKDYMELIMAVGMKFPGESRHQTALRYIRQAEESRGDAEQSGAASDANETMEGGK